MSRLPARTLKLLSAPPPTMLRGGLPVATTEAQRQRFNRLATITHKLSMIVGGVYTMEPRLADARALYAELERLAREAQKEL